MAVISAHSLKKLLEGIGKNSDGAKKARLLKMLEEPDVIRLLEQLAEMDQETRALIFAAANSLHEVMK
jgi:ribosomal protein L12E/L44/L45/RPP1/RPP2